MLILFVLLTFLQVILGDFAGLQFLTEDDLSVSRCTIAVQITGLSLYLVYVVGHRCICEYYMDDFLHCFILMKD